MTLGMRSVQRWALLLTLIAYQVPATAQGGERPQGPFDPPIDERFFESAGRILPSTGLLFRPLMADPKEMRSFVRLVRTNRRETHWPIAIGLAAPFLNLLLESGEGFQIGAGVAVFARFDETNNMDLKGTDWRYSIPIMWTSNETAYRLELRHFSSHVGDEYLERTGKQRKDALSDQVALIAGRVLRPDLRIYYGGAYAHHARPVDESFELQAGIEYVAAGHVLSGRGPYIALDFDARQEVGYAVATSAVVGLLFPGMAPGREFRAEVLYVGGPNRMSEFLDETEHYVGLGLAVDI